MNLGDAKVKHEKLVKRERGLGHVTYFSNFETPLISPQWLKIQTSNFACGLKVKDSEVKKIKKMGQKGAWPRSRDLLFKFWDPLISLERLKIQTANFACRLTVRDTKQKKMKNMSKGGVA